MIRKMTWRASPLPMAEHRTHSHESNVGDPLFLEEGDNGAGRPS